MIGSDEVNQKIAHLLAIRIEIEKSGNKDYLAMNDLCLAYYFSLRENYHYEQIKDIPFNTKG